MTTRLSRRGFVAGAAAALGDAAISVGGESTASATQPADVPGEDYRIKNGRIKHSVMGWCYNPIPTEKLIEVCHRMGMPAMEGISRQHYPKLKELGMEYLIDYLELKDYEYQM